MLVQSGPASSLHGGRSLHERDRTAAGRVLQPDLVAAVVLRRTGRNGKEGVDGSSPSEGSCEGPGSGAFFVGGFEGAGALPLPGPRLGRIPKVSADSASIRLIPQYDRGMPDSEAISAWIRRNEAARTEDRRRDAERSMSERLEQAVRLSRTASELAENMGRSPDVRPG